MQSAEASTGNTPAEPIGMRDRLLAFARLLMFWILCFLLFRLFLLPTCLVSEWPSDTWKWLVGGVMISLSAITATALLSRFEKIPFARFGLGGDYRMRYAFLGVACGGTLLTLLLLALRLTTGFRFGPIYADPLSTTGSGLLAAALAIAVALTQETVWWGYALVTLSVSVSFWPAAVLLGVLSGVAHYNPNAETNVGLLSAAIFEVVLAWSFRRTGSLWFALGTHAAWHFSQQFLCGVPDIGVYLPGALFTPDIAGPEWLTGGETGPMGSILMVPILGLLAAAIRKLPAAREIYSLFVRPHGIVFS